MKLMVGDTKRHTAGKDDILPELFKEVNYRSIVELSQLHKEFTKFIIHWPINLMNTSKSNKLDLEKPPPYKTTYILHIYIDSKYKTLIYNIYKETTQ